MDLARLPPDAWLAALLDEASDLELDLRGFPGHMRLWPGWASGTQDLEEHLLYAVVEGAIAVHADGFPSEARAGAFLCLPPGTRFSFGVLPGTRPGAVLRVRLSLRRGGRELAAPPVAVAAGWTLHEPLAELVEEMQGEREHAPALMRALAIELFAQAFRLRAGPARRDGALSATQLLRLRRHVEQRLVSGTSPAALAHELGMSPDWFARVFRRSMGLSPRAWIVRERVHLAAARLAGSDDAVAEIADACGWRDPKLFYRQFRAVMGRPPADWRRRHAASPA